MSRLDPVQASPPIPVLPTPRHPSEVFRHRPDQMRRDAVGELLEQMAAIPSTTLPELRIREPFPEADLDTLDVPAALRDELRRAAERGYALPVAVEVTISTQNIEIHERTPPVVEYHSTYVIRRTQLRSMAKPSGRHDALVCVRQDLVFNNPSSVQRIRFRPSGSTADVCRIGTTLLLLLGIRAAPTFTFNDMDLLIAALPTTSGLDCQRPLDSDVHRRIVAVARNRIRDLTDCLAWSSGYLDTAHSFFTPECELAEVTEHASNLAALRARIGNQPAGEGPEVSRARHYHREQITELEILTDSLIARVAAMHHYVTLVEELSVKVAALQRMEQAREIRAELDAMARQLGADEIARSNYQNLISDMEATRAGIDALATLLTVHARPDVT